MPGSHTWLQWGPLHPRKKATPLFLVHWSLPKCFFFFRPPPIGREEGKGEKCRHIGIASVQFLPAPRPDRGRRRSKPV